MTFSFLPGKTSEALTVYRELALPLYREDSYMLSFRAFREVESPVPLDLVVVSAFRGMGGMDSSNESLRSLSEARGSSVAEIYGKIGSFSSAHTDEFVEMLPALGSGDPSSKRITAFVRYRVDPGQGELFETTIEKSINRWERKRGVASSTGRFILSDDWDYLRMLGFDSLAAFQAYWSDIADGPGYANLEQLTVRRSQIIVGSIPELAIR